MSTRLGSRRAPSGSGVKRSDMVVCFVVVGEMASAEIKQQGFGRIVGVEFKISSAFGARAIAGLELAFMGSGRAGDHLQPKPAAGLQCMLNRFAGAEADAVNIGVLLDAGRVVASVGGDHKDLR